MRIADAFWRGCPAWQLGVDGASATVLEHGGQLVSWCVAGMEQLFVSDHARPQPGQHMRGGIPVSFPQFDQRGPLPRHGFVRQLPWRRDAAYRDALRTVLCDDVQTRGIWPHAFALSQRIVLTPNSLCVHLGVLNTGAAPFAFTVALHTYLRIDNITAAALHGLQGMPYVDNFTDMNCLDAEPTLVVSERLGRVYPQCDGTLRLMQQGRSLRLQQQGFEDVVVWNPHAAGVTALTDLAPQAWQQFLCVEAARVLRPVILQPGAAWNGCQVLEASLA